MRAIDADALIEKIRKLPNAGIRWLVSAEAVFDAILNAPTIKPRSGKWIKISPANIYKCSVCGQNVMTNDIEAYKFCHGCGAEMERKQNEIDSRNKT